MPPQDEMFSKSEALTKLMDDYKVPRSRAESAVRKAESGGKGDIFEFGLVVERVFSVPGPPQFTVKDAGR